MKINQFFGILSHSFLSQQRVIKSSLIILFLTLSACGITKRDAPLKVKPDKDDPLSSERAVFIEEVYTDSSGSEILCRLNSELVGIGRDIPVFIEFEGTKVETKIFPNSHDTVPFSRYKPPHEGELVCVIDFSGTEFDSESLTIRAQ